MTREEAIELLDNLIGMVEDNHNSDYDTAFKMAIKALEQKPKTWKWIDKRTYMKCPNCCDIWHYEENQTERFKFCPTCGERIE